MAMFEFHMFVENLRKFFSEIDFTKAKSGGLIVKVAKVLKQIEKTYWEEIWSYQIKSWSNTQLFFIFSAIVTSIFVEFYYNSTVIYQSLAL